MKRIAAAFLLAVTLTAPAAAQTTCPPWGSVAVLTVGMWQACFDAKQNSLGYTPLNLAGGTMTGPLGTAPSGTSAAGLNVPPGAAPSSPNDGDIWTTTSSAYWQFNGATHDVGTNRQAIPLTSGASLAGGATRFFVHVGNASEVIAGALSPIAATFRNFYASVDTAPAGSDTVTFTLRVNAIDTSVTCVISAAATACNDTTHTAAVTAGQLWSVKAVSSATAASTAARAGVQLDNQ